MTSIPPDEPIPQPPDPGDRVWTVRELDTDERETVRSEEPPIYAYQREVEHLNTHRARPTWLLGAVWPRPDVKLPSPDRPIAFLLGFAVGFALGAGTASLAVWALMTLVIG